MLPAVEAWARLATNPSEASPMKLEWTRDELLPTPPTTSR